MNPLETDVDLERELAAYGLRAEPFQPGTTQQFVWRGGQYRTILSGLKASILGDHGLLLLTGDVGTGKTTLVDALLEDLGDAVIVARVVSSSLEPCDFLGALADACGVDRGPVGGDLWGRLGPALEDSGERGKRVLLVIDEAQSLGRHRLAEIHELATMGHERPGRLSILLVGQNELAGMLAEPDHSAILARVKFRASTAALTAAEVRQYVQHRLKMAGAGRRVFTAGALREIVEFSQGIPRLVNVIGDLALTSGYRRSAGLVSADVVKECAGKLGRPRRRARTPRPRPDTTARRDDDHASAATGGAENGAGRNGADWRAAPPSPPESELPASPLPPGERNGAPGLGAEPHVTPTGNNGTGEPAGAPVPMPAARSRDAGAPELDVGPGQPPDAPSNGSDARTSLSAESIVAPVGWPLGLPGAETSSGRTGRAGRLAGGAVVVALALASIIYLEPADRWPDQNRTATGAAPSERSGIVRESSGAVAPVVPPAQASEIDIDMLKAGLGFIDLPSVPIAPVDVLRTDVVATERPGPTGRILRPTSRRGVVVEETEAPGPGSGPGGRFQEARPVSRPPSAARGATDGAEPVNADDIIDWLLNEYPGRRP